jgi:hypothetical protein
MAIDFTLIEQSTKYSIGQINEKIPTVCPYVFILPNFIDPTLLGKLYQYSLVSNNWCEQELYGSLLYATNRFKINWEADTVIEEVHTVFENLTDTLNQVYKKNYKFLGINLWKDSAGFHTIKHVDNPGIDLSIQIYLNDIECDLGTKFEYANTTIKTPYIKNFGYMMDNDGKITHYFDSVIPPDYTRYSLYAIWSNNK